MTPNMTNTNLLRIYMQDHFAGSVAAHELARRTQANNAGTPLGDYLVEFIEGLLEDQKVLEDLLDSIDATPNRIKSMAAWVAEKAGRLKLNGQATGYSDLSRVLETEGLALAVEGKVSLWRALKEIAPRHTFLQGIDFDRLIERGRDQNARLDEFRLEAAAIAFGGAETTVTG